MIPDPKDVYNDIACQKLENLQLETETDQIELRSVNVSIE